MPQYKITEVEGIGPSHSEKLKTVGIDSTDDFLKLCCSKKGRNEVAEKTGISQKLILSWTNMADLMRIGGIGKQFAELLEAAGVDTVKELATRNAANLATKMTEVNAEKNLTKGAVTEGQVQGWIDEAKKTDPVVTY
ncbi:MAG: ferredoxin [Planctomycetota bacterium]|nr:MAG: ferredoxin [Planctomycetota bacterium]